LDNLFTEARPKTPAERGKLLETSKDLEAAHTASAQSGQTAYIYSLFYRLRITPELASFSAPEADEHVNLHFAAFVEHQGHLVELDVRNVGDGRISIKDFFLDLGPKELPY